MPHEKHIKVTDRSVSPTRIRVRQAVAAAALTAIGLAGANFVGERVDNAERIKLEQTEDIRNAVKANVQANEHRAAGEAFKAQEVVAQPETRILENGGVQYDPAKQGVYQDPTETP